MGNGNWWKCGLFLGLGIVVGAAGAILVSRNGAGLRKGCARVLSHAVDLKDRAGEMAATARENLEDIAAEARFESDKRKEQAS